MTIGWPLIPLNYWSVIRKCSARPKVTGQEFTYKYIREFVATFNFEKCNIFAYGTKPQKQPAARNHASENS